MEIRSLTRVDINSMWEINEQGLPGTGKVSLKEISHLLDISELALGVYEGGKLLGFVLCLLPKTNYGSLNYAWFNERYDEFIYVDRIAVSEEHRNHGVGTDLYGCVISYSQQHNVPIAAEVNSEPPNPGSMRFHVRQKFEEIGTLQHEYKAVTMLMRKVGDESFN